VQRPQVVRDEVLRAPHDPREVAYAQLPALAKGLSQREAGGIGECFSTLCGVKGLTFAQQSCAYGLGAGRLCRSGRSGLVSWYTLQHLLIRCGKDSRS